MTTATSGPDATRTPEWSERFEALRLRVVAGRRAQRALEAEYRAMVVKVTGAVECLDCGRFLREDECRVCGECVRESLNGDQSEPMGPADD